MRKLNISKIALIAGHVVFWLFNYWLIAFGSSFNWNGLSNASGSLQQAYMYGLFFNALLFYIQVFWLFPKMYVKNKKMKFYITSVSIIISISLLETYFDYLLLNYFGVKDEPIEASFNTNTLIHILYSIAGFYYILKYEYKKSEKLRQVLQEETYKTELKYLKAQLNPHFLFNGINSVYHLIGKNNTLAKETLHQFSDLLRYQLYESNAYILLKKELDFVLKYIKIEKTRRGSDIRLDYDIKSSHSELKIAPLLLIPFIENAFKHCSNHIDSRFNTIKIEIKEIEGELHLSVVNSYDNLADKNRVGGIGLQNVQKRLNLLYPDRHELYIKKDKTNYIVNLSIIL